MQATVELGRIVRTRINIPLKAPLREAIVVHLDADVRNKIESAKQYIIEELNVRVLTVTGDKAKYGVQLRCIPNHRVLGNRLKQDYKTVMEALKKLSSDELDHFVTTGCIKVCNYTFSKDDLSVVYVSGEAVDLDPTASTKLTTGQDRTGAQSKLRHQTSAPLQRYEAASGSHGLLILLDTTADPDLEDERIARELVNRIQRTRKKC
ncbi:unnamed protein product [Dicrocoelium dendriticum]|nr:unnamed protein product [Dicrocoelium dendriticum]